MKALVEIFVALCVLCFNTTFGQEYTHSVKGAKKVEISQLTGEIKIVGHTGSDLIINVTGIKATPERAKGLRPLSAVGVENTKIGLSVNDIDNIIAVSGVTKQSADANYTFMVPNNLAVKIDYSSPFTSEDVVVEDFGGEIEIKTMNADVIMKDVTGPVVLDLMNGDIDLVFGNISQQSPMSIKSLNGDVDITMPPSAKVNLDLSSMHGDIYSDLDIEMERSNNEKGLKFIGGMSNINGMLNGGGVIMAISSMNGNIYLRSK
ncbi:MAG: DUF4097 family beta strand repeat-containing protein [Bacteroidales bacterium]